MMTSSLTLFFWSAWCVFVAHVAGDKKYAAERPNGLTGCYDDRLLERHSVHAFGDILPGSDNIFPMKKKMQMIYFEKPLV